MVWGHYGSLGRGKFTNIKDRINDNGKNLDRKIDDFYQKNGDEDSKDQETKKLEGESQCK